MNPNHQLLLTGDYTQQSDTDSRHASSGEARDLVNRQQANEFYLPLAGVAAVNYTCPIAGGNDMETTSRTLKQKAIQQMKEFLLIALYLWLVFGLLVMYKSVILGEYHID